MTDTANAPERIWAWPHGETDWTDIISAFFKNPTWISKKRGVAEYVLSTHCDELVAAARAEGAREAQAKIARLTEATDMAINRLELRCDEAWNGDARDFKRSLVGVFAEYRAALQENANG